MAPIHRMEGAASAKWHCKRLVCFVLDGKHPYVDGNMSQNPIPPPKTDAALLAAIAAHVAATDKRISRFEHDGQIIWIKRQEKLSLRMRLQKGDAQTAFRAERAALHRLQTAGVPVPKILLEGPDFIATADSGPTLQYLLQAQSGTVGQRATAFAAAGAQLAAMHASHLSHGRPSVKDICWDNGQITFLDFERFHAKRNTPKGHAHDLIMMVFSAYAITGCDCPEIDAAINGYRKNDPDLIWERAARWCHKMRWVDIATKPVQWRGPGKAREFKAIPLTLTAFARS